MAITKVAERQTPLVATVDINYTDIVSGVAAAAIDLPPDAVVTGGDVAVVTPFNSGTSDVLDVGDAGSGSRYLNDANIHAAGRTALVPTGYRHPGGALTVTLTAAGAAATAGKVRLTVEYIQLGRSSETYK